MKDFKFFEDLKLWADQFPWLEMATSLSILIVIAIIANFVAKQVVVRGVRALLKKMPFINDELMAQYSVIRLISHIVPAIVILNGIRTVPYLSADTIALIQMFAQAFIFITIARSIAEFLNIFNTVYQSKPSSKNKPIKGYLQLVKLIVFIVCGLLILATFLKKDVFTLLAGFGAMAAVLMLVFQNTILSLVASVQIASYDMVRVGDWIELPNLNANGTVIDMSLHTITVQNFDKTYTTIPTNKLVTDSFKNWRGMREAGCRRINRSIIIDQNSICFLTREQMKAAERFMPQELWLSSDPTQFDDSNPYRATNFGIFRNYVVLYLTNHPKIAKDQTIIARQAQPTSAGLPLELYTYAATTVWTEYEMIQCDILEHLIAMAPQFGLSIYQAPSGDDISRALIQASNKAA